MKIYKLHFDKKDTPFIETYQSKAKYHTTWTRLQYTKFLDHEVLKIKLFGLFTIYKNSG